MKATAKFCVFSPTISYMWTLRKVLFPQVQLRELFELNYNISAKTPSSFVLYRFKCKSHFPQPK